LIERRALLMADAVCLRPSAISSSHVISTSNEAKKRLKKRLLRRIEASREKMVLRNFVRFYNSSTVQSAVFNSSIK